MTHSHALIEQFLNMLGKLSSLREFLGQLARLGLRGHLARQKQPEHTFGDNLLSTRSRRENLLAVWNAQPVEADTLWVRN